MSNRIAIRVDTAANWTSNNPVLAAGEWGRESDTDRQKIGDGATAWTALAYDLDGSFGYRNLLINANFGVNQQAVTTPITAGGAKQYFLDRWNIVTNGQTVSWATTAGKTTVTVPAAGIEQIIEGALLQTGTYTISWEGTATCTVGGTARLKNESFSITGGANVSVRFLGGTVSNPQLEFGTRPTNFENRPIGLELSLCQRYVQRFGGAGSQALSMCTVWSTASAIYTVIPLIVEMRVLPTMTFSRAAALVALIAGTTYPSTAIGGVGASSTTKLIELNNSHSAGLSVGLSGWYRFDLATDFLLFTAEL